jgi:hypothetical protein
MIFGELCPSDRSCEEAAIKAKPARIIMNNPDNRFINQEKLYRKAH